METSKIVIESSCYSCQTSRKSKLRSHSQLKNRAELEGQKEPKCNLGTQTAFKPPTDLPFTLNLFSFSYRQITFSLLPLYSRHCGDGQSERH